MSRRRDHHTIIISRTLSITKIAKLSQHDFIWGAWFGCYFVLFVLLASSRVGRAPRSRSLLPTCSNTYTCCSFNEEWIPFNSRQHLFFIFLYLFFLMKSREPPSFWEIHLKLNLRYQPISLIREIQCTLECHVWKASKVQRRARWLCVSSKI
jgi:hypothetical protein